MKLRRLTPSDILLILINLFPVIGVWFLGWDAMRIFLVYAVETIIIGVFTVLKMAIVTIFVKPTDYWQSGGQRKLTSGWFFIFFFMLHYGIFVFVQTQIFFGVSDVIKSTSTWGNYAAIPGALGEDGRLLLFVLIGYHVVQTYLSFIRTGEYRSIPMFKLMFQPYSRIIVQQFVVILGGFFVSFGLGKIFIVILAACIVFVELFSNFNKKLDEAFERQEKVPIDPGE
ncbi:MAG TPA: DUF6498-containing protein [Ferruginibacter sp.]|nr:DUF6498-containing protein [Ferruginibacter sp.]